MRSEAGIVYCANHECGSNGGKNFSAVPQKAIQDALDAIRKLYDEYGECANKAADHGERRVSGAYQDKGKAVWLAYNRVEKLL